MKLFGVFFKTVIMAFLITILTVITASSTLAGNWDSESISYSTVAQKNELQQAVTLEKLVCRYIDGHKRCWHE
jgi:hypothetical protein